MASTGPDGVFGPTSVAIAVPGRDATADQLAQYGRSIARYQTSSPEASRRTQAEHEAALRAEPEHELPPAAQQLSDAVFPWTLPFSEPDEKTWILAEHLGLPLSEVVELFRTARGASAGTDAEIVRADLHISAQQWNLLVAEPVGDARRFWGGADTTSLAEMPNFLARTGLSYVEVEALAGSWFFSSRGTPLLRVQPGADRCDIRTYRVLGLEGEDVLDRLHRFLRLRQQLGWSLDALDGMLAAFGQHAIDEHALLNARLVRKVAGLLRLSIEATTKLFVLPSRDDERERRTRAWAHAFRLRTEEFMQLVKVAGATLLESTQTTAVGVLRLIELRSAIEQSGFSIGELAYLLMHEDQAPPAFAPHESDLRAFLTGLHSFVGETTAEKHRLAEAERLRELDEFKKAEPPPTEEAIEARRSELFGRDRFKIADEIEELVVVNLAGFIGASVEVTARLLQNTTADDGTFVSPAILRIVSDPTRPAPATADFLAFAQFDPGPGAIDVTGTDEYRNALRLLIRLIKAARLASAFDLGVQELSAFQLVRATNDFLDFNELPFESAAISVGERERRSTQWHALASAAQLRKSLPKSHQNLFSFLVHPQLAEASPERLRDAATYEYLSEHTGWSATDLAALQAGFGFRGEDFRRVDAYRRLATAVEWMRRWKISPANLVLLGTAPRSGEETQVLVTTLAGLGRAKHQDDTAWFTTLAPLMDVVREKKRDALLGYLLHHRMTDDRRTRQFADSTAVYGHYLIDPEMSACQLTSRIVQAHAAIQLFVQRCRMSLEEPRVSLGNVSTTELWGQWDWMKNYRVWEANRKIFLYPENWIEPDLRDDKSPFFEELESELLQNEVTQESAEGACRNYLAKLDEVARLDVRGLYEEVRNEGGQEEITLHVVARTYSAPHVYFYRKRTADRIWTPWEKIELSIEGDHVFPVGTQRASYVVLGNFHRGRHVLAVKAPMEYLSRQTVGGTAKRKQFLRGAT